MLEALACALGLARQLAGEAAWLGPLAQGTAAARSIRLGERLRDAAAGKPSLPPQVSAKFFPTWSCDYQSKQSPRVRPGRRRSLVCSGVLRIMGQRWGAGLGLFRVCGGRAFPGKL